MIDVNIDNLTGIRYGFIPYNDVYGDALDEVFSHGENLSYEAAKEEKRKEIRAGVEELLDNADLIPTYWIDRRNKIVDDAFEALWESIEHEFNDGYNTDDDRYRFEQDGYVIETTSDCELVVIKSPYYALRGLCSPCAPNAGHLRTEGGYKTYCLGHDWFDSEKAPYQVFDVATGEEVESYA